MKYWVAVTTIILAIGFALGCAVQGRPFERASSPPGTATIYVYRPYNFIGVALDPLVTCGGDPAAIGPGGYHAFVVPAGQTIKCAVQVESADVIEIHTEPRVYYIREEIGIGLLVGHPHLNPIDADQAQTEIQSCCVLEN